jgi:hypothetical protein
LSLKGRQPAEAAGFTDLWLTVDYVKDSPFTGYAVRNETIAILVAASNTERTASQLHKSRVLQGFAVCSIRDLASLKPSIIPRAFVRQRYDRVRTSLFE